MRMTADADLRTLQQTIYLYNLKVRKVGYFNNSLREDKYPTVVLLNGSVYLIIKNAVIKKK